MCCHCRNDLIWIQIVLIYTISFNLTSLILFHFVLIYFSSFYFISFHFILPTQLNDWDPDCRLLQDDQKESGLLIVLSGALKQFDFRRQPRSHAATGVEAVHITIRLLQQLSSQGIDSQRIIIIYIQGENEECLEAYLWFDLIAVMINRPARWNRQRVYMLEGVG